MRSPQPAAVLELLKPITWFPPMWAFGCGVVSTAGAATLRWELVVAGIFLAGPLVCGSSQAINDWYDRHVDAVNQPERPIPSGRIPGNWGIIIAIVWCTLSIAVASLMGPFVTAAAIVGVAFAWAYSAPPLRLKLNGWWGNSAVAICYEGLPWVTGAAIAASGAVPPSQVLVLAALYSLGAHGIMTLNDFKAIEGDLQHGVRSLPVQLGPERAARVACAVMAAPQVIVIALLFLWDRPYHATAIVGLLLAQLWCMARLLQNPRERAPWYNATGVSLYVSGMLISAFALQSQFIAGSP